eukprot:TRINITY_DN25998_c0_g1_i1.p1 TRINITY_DN25998_c0_g1~~TRINITY_DN25998_c0_g1_i1.p1  ORF type:complete len:696 (-),score=87.29 TRINITY_DN25998_c0_g1_i1:38-2125(-)
MSSETKMRGGALAPRASQEASLRKRVASPADSPRCSDSSATGEVPAALVSGGADDDDSLGHSHHQRKRSRKTSSRKSGGSPSSQTNGPRKSLVTAPVLYRKRLFFLGLLFGVAVGVFVIGPPVPVDMDFLRAMMDTYLPDIGLVGEIPDQIRQFRLADLSDYFPKISWSLFSSVERPGIVMAAQGMTAKHPIVLIPGFVTTGLELWQGDACALKYFRQRMWGTLTMLQTMLLQPECWLTHMSVDQVTGLDPPQRKLRPAVGFEAADYLMPGYWVWYKLIENLADVGYDNNNMYMATFDWRLAPQNMEIRDSYFTKLKQNIELMVSRYGKVAVIAHSLGGNAFHYFMKWVESPVGGKGGPLWVNDHIMVYVNIAAPLLGLSKSISALLSGEMKDTAQLGALEHYLTGKFTPVKRRQLWRTWYSIAWMLPRGGDKIWGGGDYDAPEDSLPIAGPSWKYQVRFTDDTQPRNLTTEESLAVLAANISDHFGGNMYRWFSYDSTNQPDKAQFQNERSWTNPLESSLPNAPNMTIFCLYGVGKPTERGYFYRKAGPFAKEAEASVSDDLRYFVDKSYNSVNGPDGTVINGVRFSEGDGTVGIVSLGYMCTGGWKFKPHNPGGARVITREYKHQTIGLDLRGGSKTGDHVDIMGNFDMTTDILKIVVGFGHLVEPRVISTLPALTEVINRNLGLGNSSRWPD